MLLGTDDDDALLDVLTEYFTDNTHEETEGKTTFTLYYIKMKNILLDEDSEDFGSPVITTTDFQKSHLSPDLSPTEPIAEPFPQQ